MREVDSFVHFGGRQNSKIPALYNPQDCDYDGFDSWTIPMIRLCYMVQLILKKGAEAWDFPGEPVVKTPLPLQRRQVQSWSGN